MIMSRFQNRDLFLVRPGNGVYKDGIHKQFHFSLRIRRTSVRRSLALVITKWTHDVLCQTPYVQEERVGTPTMETRLASDLHLNPDPSPCRK